jgi:imidazole glycerol-phosphate synthase subunit HisF
LLTKRIIACLDCHAGRVVKGVNFANIRDAGDPAELACVHASSGADEIVLLDITATHEARKTLIDTVRSTARELFIPFTVGGGIRSLDDASAIFDAGADKITINSAAVANPDVITQIAHRFGSQAVVLAIDAKRREEANVGTGNLGAGALARSGRAELDVLSAKVYVSGGRTPTGLDALSWAREAESHGAGEIMLTSMDRDGTRAGFDLQLTAAIANALSIPVIASGGAGSADHFVEVFRDGKADAALAASIFHFGLQSIGELKQHLQAAGIPVRWPL